ncbi:hypothetical protein [Viridibacillus arvi]|uniref:hypothetical protein n=1 Tax=Viridibacillus arvi TaxID=263475 RepID=UPI0034CF8327
MENRVDHLGRYEFSIGEVVMVGGNPNILAEVLDATQEQLQVRVLTPPSQGKILYTTKYTYYTQPVHGVTPKEVKDMLQASLVNKEVVSTSTDINEEVIDESASLINEKSIEEPVIFSEELIEIDTSNVSEQEDLSVKQVSPPPIEINASMDEDFGQLSLF